MAAFVSKHIKQCGSNNSYIHLLFFLLREDGTFAGKIVMCSLPLTLSVTSGVDNKLVFILE